MDRPKGAQPFRISAPASTAERVNRMRYSAPRTRAGARSTSLPVRAISSRAWAALAFQPTFTAMAALLLCIG